MFEAMDSVDAGAVEKPTPGESVPQPKDPPVSATGESDPAPLSSDLLRAVVLDNAPPEKDHFHKVIVAVLNLAVVAYVGATGCMYASTREGLDERSGPLDGALMALTEWLRQLVELRVGGAARCIQRCALRASRIGSTRVGFRRIRENCLYEGPPEGWGRFPSLIADTLRKHDAHLHPLQVDRVMGLPSCDQAVLAWCDARLAQRWDDSSFGVDLRDGVPVEEGVADLVIEQAELGGYFVTAETFCSELAS